MERFIEYLREAIATCEDYAHGDDYQRGYLGSLRATLHEAEAFVALNTQHDTTQDS